MRTFILVAWALVAILLAACGSGPEQAAVGTSSSDRVYKRSPARWSPGRRGDYANYPAAARLIDRLVRKKGFRRAYLERIFARVEREQRVLDLVNRPRARRSMQSSGSWTRYRAKFLTLDNILNGIGFGRRYGSTLRRAQARYGVPPEYVLAIIGVETRYGAYLGKYRVIDALATLAFDYPRRSRFFTGELESFLIVVRNEGMDPFKPRGSYAGAMGPGQFMPSSFQRWAVDFDGNGKRDLWNPVDAIGSIASYFASHGWRRGEPVAVRASVNGRGAGALKTGCDTSYSPTVLRRHGIAATAGLGRGRRVSLIRLDAAGGYQYWLGLRNFYIITRYNHSSYYAMAVHQLAQKLRSWRSSGKFALAQARTAESKKQVF